MKKIFTEAKRQELLALVEEVEREQTSDIAEYMGDFFGHVALNFIDALGLRSQLYYTRDYEKLMLDTCNATKDSVNKLFEAVSRVDSRYAAKADEHRKGAYLPVKRYLKALVQSVDPAAGAFTRASIGARFAGMDLPRINPTFTRTNAGNKLYGGDQGAYRLNPDAYAAIVRKHFPDYSDKEVKELLEQLNSEGCGYVALCNTLFKEYVGREDEFFAKFGFPLYDDGHFNYGAMVVDLYCAEDDAGSSGTTAISRKGIWEQYLKDHGVKARVDHSVAVTPQNYGLIAKSGDIIVGASPVKLYDESGSRVFYSDGGHAMTVTGVTDDGKFIVSSWGEKYYLDPNDYQGDDMVVGYTNGGKSIVVRDGKRVIIRDGNFNESGHLVFSRVRY